MKRVSKQLMSMALAAVMAGSAVPSAALAANVTVNDTAVAQTVEADGVTVTANTLTYNGSYQALVSSTGSYDQVRYSIDDKTYNYGAPTGKDAGTYTVYYKVGDSDTKNTIQVTIEKAEPTISIGSGVTATYDGQSHNVSASVRFYGTDVSKEGTLTYNYEYTNSNGVSKGSASDAKEAGTYTLSSVTFTANGTSNYKSVTQKPTSATQVKINKKSTTIELEDTTRTFGSTQGIKTKVDGENYDGDSKGSVTYTYKNSAGKTFNDLPSTIGTYTVTAVLEGNNNYASSSTSKSATLTIKAADDSYTVSAGEYKDVYYTGKEVTGKGSATYNNGSKYTGTISYKYKSTTGDTNTYNGMPADAGTYKVYASITYTDSNGDKKTITSEPSDLTIEKAKLTIDTTGVGETYAYTGDKVSGFKAYLNKGTDYQVDVTSKLDYSYTTWTKGADGTYTKPTANATSESGLPSKTGKYTITVKYPKDDSNIDSTGLTASGSYYAVAKDVEITATTVVIDSTPVDATGSKLTATNGVYQFTYTGSQISLKTVAKLGTVDYSSKVQYKYKEANAADSSYKTGLPTDKGGYTVVAYIDDATDGSYKGASQTFSVYIAEGSGNLTLPTTTKFDYTGKAIDFKATTKYTDTTIQYSYWDNAQGKFVDGLPKDVGSYIIKVTLPKTSSHDGDSQYVEGVTISAVDPTLTFADKTVTYDGKEQKIDAAVKLVNNEEYKGTVKYSYKVKGADDSTYTATAPKNAGEYTVKAEVTDAGKNYNTKTATAALTIKKKELSLKWTPDCADGCVYNGKEHSVTVALKDATEIVSGDDVKVSVENATQTEIGTYTLTAVLSGESKDNYAAKTSDAAYKFVISSHKHEYVTRVITPATPSADGIEEEVCEKENCADPIKSTATIARPNKVTLSRSSYVYSGKNKNPVITVLDANGEEIDDDNYTVSYPNGRKLVGTRTVKIKFNGERYSGTMSATFTIKPQATKITKRTAGKKAMTIKFKKVSKQISGYQIEYSRKSDFSNSQTINVSKSKTSQYISGLTSGKKYYVRIRTYKVSNDLEYASAWSNTKTVKVK